MIIFAHSKNIFTGKKKSKQHTDHFQKLNIQDARLTTLFHHKTTTMQVCTTFSSTTRVKGTLRFLQCSQAALLHTVTYLGGIVQVHKELKQPRSLFCYCCLAQQVMSRNSPKKDPRLNKKAKKKKKKKTREIAHTSSHTLPEIYSTTSGTTTKRTGNRQT